MQKFQGELEKLDLWFSLNLTKLNATVFKLNPWSSEFRVILHEKTIKFQPSSDTGAKGAFFNFMDCAVVCFVFFLLIRQWILQSIFVGLLLG